MTESELLRLMRLTIKQELAKILMGKVVSNEDSNRLTISRFGESPIGNLRRIQPYGLASRAPKDTQTLIIPIAGDPTHLVQVGEFDEGRPDIQDGEAILYGADGQVVYMKTGGEIHLGSKTSASPMVLGDVMQNFASALLDEVKTIVDAIKSGPVAVTTTPGNPAPTHPTLIAAMTAADTAIATMKSTYVTSSGSNFLANKSFLEKG